MRKAQTKKTPKSSAKARKIRAGTDRIAAGRAQNKPGADRIAAGLAHKQAAGAGRAQKQAAGRSAEALSRKQAPGRARKTASARLWRAPQAPSAGRAELAQKLSFKLRIQKSLAERIVETVFQEIEAAILRGNRVEIRGFGSFHVKLYKGYRGSHPKTGASIQVKPKRRAVFRPSRIVKQLLNPAAKTPAGAGGAASLARKRAKPLKKSGHR